MADLAQGTEGLLNGSRVDDALPIVRRDQLTAEAFHEAVWGRVFNQRRDTTRLPRAVVRAASTAHIKAAVDLAISENCRVSVRSGGHSWACWSVRQDAVLIDLENCKELRYDEATKIASCSPSLTGRVLNGYLHEKGRMFAGGHCPDVGLGGFLLQGGMGWNCKAWASNYGWGCEYIVGIDVITADARELYCSAHENEDLFWAARGAGPGFPAVVTRFHLQTRPLPQFYNSVYIWPMSEYRKVLQWVVDSCPAADRDLEIVAVAKYNDEGTEMEILAGFLAFKSTREEAEKAMAPIHATRPPNAKVERLWDPTSLEDEYNDQAAANPQDHRYCSDNAYIANDADVPSVLEAAFTTLPHKKAFSLYFAMNPTSRRQLPDMALSLQSDHFFSLYTVWQEPEDDERCTAWVRGIMNQVERHSIGSYLGDADFQHRNTRYWAETNGQRLMEIRRKWDPEGLICGYLDAGDRSGVQGLTNECHWLEPSTKPLVGNSGPLLHQ